MFTHVYATVCVNVDVFLCVHMVLMNRHFFYCVHLSIFKSAEMGTQNAAVMVNEVRLFTLSRVLSLFPI